MRVYMKRRKLVRLEDLRVGDPFNSLFPIDPVVLDRIQQDMEAKGFDNSQPIIIWAGEAMIVDGHTRYQAAKNLGIDDVPVVEKDFGDEDEALEYAIHNQRNRRNLTDEVLLACIEVVDRRLNRGGDRRSENAKSKAPIGAIGKSADYTAKVVGVSPRKVERARTVLTDPQATAEVKEGKKTIYRASQETVARRKHQSQPAPAFRDEDKRQAIIMRALAELRTWRQKYKEYVELSAIFKAIDGYQRNLESDHPLSEANKANSTSESGEPLASVSEVEGAEWNPQLYANGDELPMCCAIEDVTNEPGPSASEMGVPGQGSQVTMDPDESANEENYKYCNECQQFIPDHSKPGGEGACKIYPSFSCNGNPTICPYFKANDSIEVLPGTLPICARESAETPSSAKRIS